MASVFLRNFLKGIFIGIGVLIPGISGGTAAIITGCFEELLGSVAGITNQFKRSIKFLIPIMLGIILGVVSLSYPLSEFCDSYPILSKYIFCITSIFGIVIFLIVGLKRQFKPRYIKFIALGVIIAAIFSIMCRTIQLSTEHIGYVTIIFLSLPLSAALVLPAISFSYMLLFLGLYEKTLSAIADFDILYLSSLGTGIIIGSIIFSKLLLRLIHKYSAETYSSILGFMLYSLINIIV